MNANGDPMLEYVARRASVASAAQRATTVNVAGLLAFQNEDGGFSGAAGYASSSLDTAFALLGRYDLGTAG